MFNLHNMYLPIYWYIFFKTFCRRAKCFKLLKLASTTGKMISNTLFPFCCPNMLHSCLKSPILDVESSFHQLIFQYQVAFYLFTAFFSHIWSKKHHFSDSKHFHARGFNFHGINAPSTTVDLISNCFMPHLRVNCKKQRPIIFKLELVKS